MSASKKDYNPGGYTQGIMDPVIGRHGEIRVYDGKGNLKRIEQPVVSAKKKSQRRVHDGHETFICIECGLLEGRKDPSVVRCADCRAKYEGEFAN